MNPLSRREFLASSAALAGATHVFAAPRSRPNILFILADDLGYGDLGCFGRPDYTTPHMDRLAAQGVRLTQAYANSTYCTPTRCAFLTGRYPQRIGGALERPIVPRGTDLDAGLSSENPTLPALLRAAGYFTALVGKWHLGHRPEFGPNRHGFEEFFGVPAWGTDYFSHQEDGRPSLYENLRPVERAGYLTDLLADRAAEIVSRRRTQPFYLSLHFTAPHWPWQPPGGHPLDPGQEETAGGSLKIFAAMVRSLDDGIGRVLKALRNSGRERDTLVILTSDNGGERYSFNWPYAGKKGSLSEGGIRVPAILRWPGVIPAGRGSGQAAITTDWHATILSAAGAKSDPAYPSDGRDLLPVLTGKQEEFERDFFWRYLNQDAARIGWWKFLRIRESESLFDLREDPGEVANLKTQHPAVLDRMKQSFARWESQMKPRPDYLIPPRAKSATS